MNELKRKQDFLVPSPRLPKSRRIIDEEKNLKKKDQHDSSISRKPEEQHDSSAATLKRKAKDQNDSSVSNLKRKDCKSEPIETPIDSSDCWPILDSYFETVGFVKHHIESFDSFFQYRAQRVVSEQPEIEITLDETTEVEKNPSQFVPTTYVMKYGQLHFRTPSIKEADGSETELTPSVARLRSLTYSSPIYIDLSLFKISNRGTPQEQIERHDSPQVFFGNIPIMVRSSFCALTSSRTNKADRIKAGECEYDEGGYFIIGGLEKIFVSQEKLPDNEVYVYEKNKVSPYSHIAQVRSISEHSGRSSASACVIGYQKSDGKMLVQIPQIRQAVPLYVVFCALGVTERYDIEQYLLCGASEDDQEMKRALMPTLRDSFMFRQRDIALDYIGKRATIVAATPEKRIEAAKQIILRELLPHLGKDDTTLLEKACFLGRMARNLILVTLKRRKIDDRDSLGSKSVELAGPLMESLFKQIMRQMTEEIRKGVVSSVAKGKPIHFAVSVKPNIMTNKMRYSFATGNWGMQRAGAAGARTGVTQPLSRQSLSATLSHSGRVNQQLSRDGKDAKPRQLNNTHWGMLCAAETPEGQACGLVKNLAILATVSTQAGNATGILEILYEFGVQPLIQQQLVPVNEQEHREVLRTVVSLSNTKVMLDCKWIGTTSEPERLVQHLKSCRRRGQVLKQGSSIVYIQEENEIRIAIDAGRVIRPLFVVDQASHSLALSKETLQNFMKKRPKTLWQDLIAQGFIEYLDVQESRNANIALYPQDLLKHPDEPFTHCELHPATMLGVSASMIPFPNHNQSPRNMYQSAMGKQAMSIATTNFLQRLDTSAHTLYYPQQPLVQTRFSRNAHFNELPTGEVAIVAILCDPQRNEEDSIVMSKASVERGLFRSTCYRTYQDREKIDSKPLKKTTSQQAVEKDEEEIRYEMPPLNKYEQFGKPPESENGYNHRYDHLDVDGLAVPGEKVGSRDILIGKTAPMPGKSDSRRDCSTLARANESARIDRVMLSDGQDGARLAKVRTRSVRIPQVGDKFSSMHGQKGTVGALISQEDMPWTSDGMSPDIIINPHAFPSRMTIGQLVETLMGKAAALTGKIGDGTPFNGTSVEDIGDLLESLGMQRHGGEVMYSGTTGMPLDSLIFIGPTFYQRLKHLSADKVHGRAQGPKTGLTRQPVEGRGRDGGLRFGEMERDCAVAYGAAEFTKDRLQYCSDNYRVPVCRTCGLIAIDDALSGKKICKRCDSHETVQIVDMPYANKLLSQELLSLGIVTRIVLK